MKKTLFSILLLVLMVTVLVGCDASSVVKSTSASSSDDSQPSESTSEPTAQTPDIEVVDISYIAASDMESLGFTLVYEGEDTHDYENEAGDYVIFYPDGTLTSAYNIDGTVQLYDIVRDGLIDDVTLNKAIDIYEAYDSDLPYYTINDQNMELGFDSEGYVISEREFTHSASEFNAGDYAGMSFYEILKMQFEYLIAE